MRKFQTVDFYIPDDKLVFFASDFHLGSMGREAGHRLERDIVAWLKSVRDRAAAIFLVGDIFDYWFEYKFVVPKGGIRLLGQLGEISDQGIPIYYFTGNHDMWMRDYLAQELNATVSRNPISFNFISNQASKRILVGHGDGLGPGDQTYKLLKVLFESRLARFLYRQVHPDLASRIALAWSRHSRAANNEKAEDTFKGELGEWLYQYCLDLEKRTPHDYYIFGHRHLPLDLKVGAESRYINLGEWFSTHSRYPYCEFDGQRCVLKNFR